MNQNKLRKTTKNTSEKDACPTIVVKQYSGTGDNRFDLQTQKTTGPSKNRIWTRADYDATPLLDLIITSFDTKKSVPAARVINEMHERFVHIILDHLGEHCIPYNTLNGETFVLTLRFTKEVPEAP